VDYKTETSPY